MSDHAANGVNASSPPDGADWAVVELMGHVRVAGLVSEEERFGTKLGRIDIPMPDGSTITQYFGGGSIYRITPTTEDVARKVAANLQPRPAHRWELPAGNGYQVDEWEDEPVEDDEDAWDPEELDLRDCF